MSVENISSETFKWQIVPESFQDYSRSINQLICKWLACYNFLNNFRTNYPGIMPTHFSSHFMTSLK